MLLRKAEISVQNNQLMTVDQLLNHGAVVDETTLFNAKNNIEVFKKCLCFADYKVIKVTVEKIPNEAKLSNFHRYPELETKKEFKKYTDNPVEYIAQQYHDNIPMLKESYDKFRNTTKNSREDYKISLIEALIVLDKKEPKLEKLKSQIEQLQNLDITLVKNILLPLIKMYSM